jgi:fatty-acyl-CoA synthase
MIGSASESKRAGGSTEGWPSFHSQTLSPIDHPARWAEYLPHRTALVGVGGTEVTYGELDRRADRLARWLVEVKGLRRNDRVALLSMNHEFFFELFFACVRAGLILAPLNYRLAPAELSQLVELSDPALLFTDETNRQTAEDLGEKRSVDVFAIDVGSPDWSSSPGSAPRKPTAEEPRRAGPEDTVLMLFTSGTTGLPKGVMLPARQILFNSINTQLAFDLGRDDSTVLYTPLFHTGAINVLAMPLLHVGGCVRIHRRFDPQRLVQTIEEHGVSTIFGVPATFEGLAAHPRFFEAARRSLRLSLCGGAPLSLRLMERFEAHGVSLTQGFGMTEVGPNCFYLPVDRVSEKAGSVGKPIHYCEARIVVGDRPAEPGEVGELQLAGPCVCKGYFRNTEATASSFDGGWFRTGDLMKRDEEHFFYVAGRKKEMFISGGENVYPAEVEVALSSHPKVVECTVVSVPDPKWGEVGCAFLAAADGFDDSGALTAFLRERLAGYKVPKRFRFVSELPRNQSGKVLKAMLTEQAESSVEAERLERVPVLEEVRDGAH